MLRRRFLQLIASTLTIHSVVLATVPTATAEPQSPRLRVLTYNIHHGEGRDGRFDYVLIRRDDPWRIVESQVIDERVASDHRPVLVVLEWTGP